MIYAEDNVVVFVRVYKQQRVLVAINRGKPARWLLKIPAAERGRVDAAGGRRRLRRVLTLPAISANVWSGR